MVRTEASYPITSWPPGERPRERLLSHGADSLSDAELVAILLRTGNAGSHHTALDDARALLAARGSLQGISRAVPAELQSTGGIGPAKAASLLAAFEMGRRVHTTALASGSAIGSSRDVFNHFHDHLRGLKKERFLILLLNGKNRVIRDILISEGSLSGSLVHPREVFSPAVRESAAAIILVHNHPSGDPTPSAEDKDLTDRLVHAGELMGIAVLDHIVIGDGRYVSFADTLWRD